MTAVETPAVRKVGGAELSRIISASHLSWDFDADRTRRLRAAVALRCAGALRFAWVRTSEWSGARKAEEIRRNPEPYLTFLMPLRGGIVLESAAGRVTVGKHELGIWDSTLPMRFEVNATCFEQMSVLVPQRLLRASRGACAAQHCRHVDHDNVLSALCIRHMATLARFLDGELKPYELSISDLTTSMFDAVIASEQRGPLDRDRLVADIKEYIESYIVEESLSARSIAEAFDVSPRYVHKLFERAGHTVGEWILRRRIERSARDLLRGDETVTTIALKWGFKDLSHYSRVFRRVHGVAPSIYRRVGN